jgi:hypothetical protein
LRLINYGPGEIADRLTILNLKQLYGKQAGKDVKHFVDERNALLAQLRSRELTGPWLEFMLELGAVNAALWQAEDELRGRRTDHARWERPDSTGLPGTDEKRRLVEQGGQIAFRIQEWNDRRAQLIEEINKATGDHLGSEKTAL